MIRVQLLAGVELFLEGTPMSKRFTETAKWDDAWFRDLSGAHKLVFLYIIDRCDNAGFWEVDEGGIGWHTKLKPEHIQGALKALERGIHGASGWVWVKNFLRHQKNEKLNPSNPAHRQIVGLIEKKMDRCSDCSEFKKFIAPLKGLLSPIGKVKVKEGVKKGSGEGKQIEDQAEEIYAAYPRKVAKPDALRAIAKALTKNTFEFLIDATRSYAKAREGQNSQFTPHPATWFNADRFLDDPATWEETEEEEPHRPKTDAERQMAEAARYKIV